MTNKELFEKQAELNREYVASVERNESADEQMAHLDKVNENFEEIKKRGLLTAWKDFCDEMIAKNPAKLLWA